MYTDVYYFFSCNFLFAQFHSNFTNYEFLYNYEEKNYDYSGEKEANLNQ